MRPVAWIAVLLLWRAALGAGGPGHTLSGYVTDASTGETVIGVNVAVRSLSIGAVTDDNGYFRIGGVPSGPIRLDFSHVAFRPRSVTVDVKDRGIVLENTALRPRTLGLDAVTVTGKKTGGDPDRMEPGYRRMTPQAIAGIPEPRKDVFSAVKYLPGVSGVDPVSPLVSVRGGDPGENLVLLDGVPIYNPYHNVQASGLFNLYAVKNVEILVGGFGAEYGGRNSSVLSVTTREGNNERLHGEIEPTLSGTNAVLDFPLGRNATMMVSGRFYYDLVSRYLFDSPNTFYDTNIALNWKLGKRHWLMLRAFQSRDWIDYRLSGFFSYFEKTFDTGLFDDYDYRYRTDWSNRAVTGVLKTVISPKVYLKTQVSGSFFDSDNRSLIDFQYTDPDTRESVRLYYQTEIRNRIRDVGGRTALSAVLGRAHTVTLGAEANAYGFENDILINRLSEGRTARNPRLAAGFAEDLLGLGPLKIRAGIRLSRFSFDGRWRREPRLSASLQLPRGVLLRAAWGRYLQFITSINSREYELSQFLDNYVPLRNREPAASTHAIVGFERGLSENSRLSVDGYIKDISRVYTFDYDVSELEAVRFTDKLRSGTGKSVGVELLWQGAWRTFSGWASYGIGRSTRRYPHIMNGKEFLFDYDRTHAFKAVITHQVHPALSYSGSLRVLSGVPATIERTTRSYFYYDPLSGAVSTYPVGYGPVRNNARLPCVIQLDAGLKKRVRKGFGADLARFLGAKESYVNVTFNNLLFFAHRNVWFYIPFEGKELYGLGTNYFPTVSTGVTVKF